MTRMRLLLSAAAAVVVCPSAHADTPMIGSSVDVELAARADVRGTLSGPDEADLVRYAAPASTTLTFSLSGGRGMDLDVRLFAPDASEVPLAGAHGYKDRGSSISLSRFALGAAGTYVLRIGSTAPGTYRLKWTATPGGKRVQKCDLRCTSLGRALGEESAVGRIAAAGSPTTLDAAYGSDLLRARLVVPADALPAGSIVMMTSTTPVAPLDPSAQQAAGPSVDVQPAGVALASPATLTLSYDRLFVPRSADPATDLLVARRDVRGRITMLAPTSVDTFDHTVTVATDEFARFAVVAPKGVPDPTTQTYWHGGMSLFLAPGSGGADSRDRYLHLQFGRAEFASDGAVPYAGDSYDASWSHDASGVGSIDLSSNLDQSDTFSWAFEPDGRRVRFTVPNLGSLPFEPLEDGTVYVGAIGSNAGTSIADLELMVRKSDRAPTRDALAGTYWIGTVELKASRQKSAALAVEAWRSFGTATLRADGKWSVNLQSASSLFDAGDRSLKSERGRFVAAGDWAMVGAEGGWREGSALLTIVQDEGPAALRIFPSADRQSFFGAIDPVATGEAMFLVGVRKSSGLSARSLSGTFAAGGVEYDVVRYQPDGSSVYVGDLEPSQAESRMKFDGTSRLVVESESLKEIRRDPDVAGGVSVSVSTDTPPAPVPFSLARTGQMSVRGEPGVQFVGAVGVGGRFGFILSAPVKGAGALGIRLFVKSPPSE